MKPIILILTLAFSPVSSHADDAPHPDEIMFINAGIGGLIATIGGWFHRDEGKYRPMRNFWKGALSGILHFKAKEMVGSDGIDWSRVDENQLSASKAWMSKLLTNFATSIEENTVHNRAWNHRFTLDAGLFLLQWDRKDSGEYEFIKRIHLGSALSALSFAAEGHKFDWSASLKTGAMIFETKDFHGFHTSLQESEVGAGTNVYGTILVRQGKEALISHELIHQYQNRFLDSLSRRKVYDSKGPYFSFGRFIGLFRMNRSYEKNWFEREAHVLDNDDFYFRKYSPDN
jgi:hypothetical protein